MQGGFLQSRTLEEFRFSRLFLASIVRVFLRLQVWLKLCKKKKLWFTFFLHAFSTSLGYLLLCGVSCSVPPV